MMKTILTVLAILLYLYFGVNLFYAALNRIGGKEEYLKTVNGTPTMYYVALVIVIFGWPVFLFSAIVDNIRRNR